MRLFIVAIISCLLFSSGKPVSTIYKTSKTNISFSSEASMEIIKAESKKLVGLINTEKKTFAFQVSVITFEGFNSDLQREHFNENYMESTKYPKIKFVGKILGDVDFSKPFDKEVDLEATLNVHGVSKARAIKAKIKKVGDKISISSSFEITLSEHNISIPTIVNQKLAKVIHVLVEAEMMPKE